MSKNLYRRMDAIDPDADAVLDDDSTTITGAWTFSGNVVFTGVPDFSGITGSIEFADGALDVDIASHDGTNGLKLGGTLVTASAAELNHMDVSAQAETIDSGVAVSVTVQNTKIDNTTSGAGAITLAAPDASMYGKVKTIEMTVDNGDVTLALTNVQGGSAATTATFDAVGETLILIGGTSKWHVIGESGVTLS